MILLERDDALATLAHACAKAQTVGQLVGVRGEAGIGKSSLLRACAEREASRRRWLWGYCEALGTPRPLGPLLDMASDLGSETRAALAACKPRHEVFAACLADLSGADEPTVVCVEDVHWADEATLDLLHFLARRLHHTKAAIVMSWRDDEVGPDHAVTRILSAPVAAAVHRIRLEPLSIDAVTRLSGCTRDPHSVLALTRGNPFFVTELAASADAAVPASVRDAVLARRARLEPDARSVLDVVSVVPSRAELSLVADAVGAEFAGLEACVTSGLLTSDAEHVAFRHELARLAVADALPAPRAQACHRRVLQALLARPNRAQWLARIVHHAEAAGAVDAVLEHAPAAARQAAALGAHRQAADHYSRALRYAAHLADADRMAIIEALAYEHYLTGDIASARSARADVLELSRRLGAPVAVGRNLRWLSRLAWFAGDGAEATSRANEAIEVLGALPDEENAESGGSGAELAMAFSNRAQIAMLASDYGVCLSWGTKAIDVARRLGAHEVLCHALNNVGTARLESGEDEGRALLEESLAIALTGNFHEHAARAYTNLSASAVDGRRYDEALRWIEAGLAYCADRDLDSWTVYMRAYRARTRAEMGLWQAATEDAEIVLATSGAMTVSHLAALGVLGLVRVRRGDPDADRVLERALEIARRTGEAQRLVPLLTVRAERAWLAGRREQLGVELEEAQAFGDSLRPADRDCVAYWRWRIGEIRPEDVDGDGPYASLIRGDWQGSAAAWRRLGCPYERALALAEGDRDAVQEAVEIFHGLGAAPAADWARQRLRELGATVVPRGRRASTLAHPAGLTVREVEVLGLLAHGLTNPQIGTRLFVSAKTVEHHVSSILGKLAVETRDGAVAHARRQGWLTDRRDAGTPLEK